MSQVNKEKEQLPSHINRKLYTATRHLATVTRDASWQWARLTKKKEQLPSHINRKLPTTTRHLATLTRKASCYKLLSQTPWADAESN